jgi:hypothetical protein
MASESGHWYAKDGTPMYTIIGANGNERNTTLRDAKKLGLVPSVTEILKVAAKPGLERWKQKQILMAALTLPKIEGESLDDFAERVETDSQEQASKARDKGVQIHSSIESGFEKGEGDAYYLAAKSWLDKEFGNLSWASEKSFASSMGYGGKCDLHNKEPKIVVDFKSKDFSDDSDVDSFVYDEHGMQLSAYAHGFGLYGAIRCNLFIRPLKEGEDKPAVLGYIHAPSTEVKHWEMFSHLLAFWQISKSYNNWSQK